MSPYSSVIPCETLSNIRDEYIVKKYIEKRWAAFSTVPDIPPAKIYRPQEARVVDLVSFSDVSGRERPIGRPPNSPVPHPSDQLRILKRNVECEASSRHVARTETNTVEADENIQTSIASVFPYFRPVIKDHSNMRGVFITVCDVGTQTG